MSFLRPHLTELLWKDLLEQRAVNLYGAPFTGRHRLLGDVQQWAHTHSETKTNDFFLINIKNYISLDYQSFLNDLTHKMDVSWPLNDLAMPHTFKNIVRLGLASQRKIIFLWYHLDALFDNENHRFPQAFFDDLNSLKNTYPNFHCCCVTEKPHNQSRFKAVDAAESRMSWLELFPRDMAFHPLTLQEIRAELKHLVHRRQDKEQLAAYIHQDAAPMQLFVALQNTMHLKCSFGKLKKEMERFRKTKYGNPNSKPSFFNRIFQWMAWKN